MAAQEYFRSFALAPNPQDAQRFFCTWKAWRPQRRQRVWFGLWNLPFDDVPFDTRVHLRGSERSRDDYLMVRGALLDDASPARHTLPGQG
jgi:hypothetical protein